MLTHRDAEALANERQQIPFGGMDGDTAHGNVFAHVFAAFGERDVERLCGSDRIVKKQLIEIAHPIKQQRALVLGFDLQILRHHWRHGRFL